MPRIIVYLPRNRAITGTLTLLDDAGLTLAGPFQVSGRADLHFATIHGNPGRSAILKYGDTPTGSYRVDGFQFAADANDTRRHGPNGKIRIVGIGGEALLAVQNGRDNLQIHGGVLGASGNLRPTNGCLRMTDSDMADLISAILLSGSPPVSCEALVLNVTSNDARIVDDVGSDDDGDPPNDSGRPWTSNPSPMP